jgi:hypothetical protein
LLDAIIPFSSVILLGVVVAVEDHYAISITRDSLINTCAGGSTLRKLALMIESLKTEQTAGAVSSLESTL